MIDKAEAEKLAKTVEEASEMLDKYNERLTQELQDRKKLSKALAPFITSQKDKLAESQQKLQVQFLFSSAILIFCGPLEYLHKKEYPEVLTKCLPAYTLE